jgi:hypothetical protein
LGVHLGWWYARQRHAAPRPSLAGMRCVFSVY